MKRHKARRGDIIRRDKQKLEWELESMRKRWQGTLPPIQKREVRWYRNFGKYPSRIALDGTGKEYVIGDWSWNRNHRNMHELVEERMRTAGVYKQRAESPKRLHPRTQPTEAARGDLLLLNGRRG